MRFTVLASAVSLAESLTLSSVHIKASEAEHVQSTAAWWARVDDKVFYYSQAGPEGTSMMQVGQASGCNMYYSLGSEEALTDEMRKRRVGGQGRFHIFYLPEGRDSLKVQSNGDRRSTFSSLVQLSHGSQLSVSVFPAYKPEHNVEVDETVVSLEEQAAKVITPEVYLGFLKKITSVEAGGVVTRSWKNTEASTKAQDLLVKEFTELGAKACKQEFQHEGYTLVNVIGFILGSTQDGSSVTLGAHYDSRPFEDAPAPGAVDNGSGVAGLLAALKAFHEAKVQPTKNVYFVAFSGEEAGLLGSEVFAQSLLGTGEESAAIPTECLPSGKDPSFLQPQGSSSSALSKEPTKHQAIVMDEIGWASDKTGNPVNFESSDTGGNVDLMDGLYAANKEVNGEGALPVIHNKNPFGSDHMSFIGKGIASVLLIMNNDEGYGHYHKSTDTIENVNTDYATKICRIALAGLIKCATDATHSTHHIKSLQPPAADSADAAGAAAAPDVESS